MKPLSDAFICLIRAVVPIIIFATVVVGIAKMGDMRRVGVVGVKAIVYFEVVSTIALLVGLFGRQRAPARRRHAHQSRLIRRQGGGALCHRRQVADHRRFPDEDGAHQPRRRSRQGRHHAGADHGGAVRLRALPHGRARRPRCRAASTISRTQSSAWCASSCTWRRSRPSPPWPSRSASSASARLRASGKLLASVYLTLDPVRAARLRPDRAALRPSRVEAHPLLQGRAADRLQRYLGRGDDPARGRSNSRRWAAPRRWWAWSCRPGSRSTWTAPRST